MSSARLSIAAAYVCAALGATASIFAFAEWFVTLAVWLALGVTWGLHESGRRPHLPDWITKHGVALPIFALTWVDFAGGSALMAVVTHLMGMLQIAKAIKRKVPADLWTMYMISLLQMIAGSVVALDVAYFALWVVYAGASIFFLNLVILQPAAEDRTLGIFVPPGRSLAGRAAKLSVSIWLVVLIGASFSFIFFPRDFGGLRQMLNMRRNSDRLAWSAGLMIPDGPVDMASGISNSIDMSSLGSVILDPTEALEARFTRNGLPFRPDPEDVYLKGLSFDQFDGRKWFSRKQDSASRRSADFSERPSWHPATGGDVAGVTVRPLSERSPWLFLPRPCWNVDMPYIGVDTNHNLTRHQNETPAYSAAFAWRPWERGLPPGTWGTHDWMELPNSAHTEEYDRLAERILGRLPRAQRRNTHERAKAIAQWLSENCEYTLQLEWQSNSDPVHEFLKRRRGYCVYFASAMAVLLRSVRTPCRVVVGYAGGRWDERRQCMVLRKSDAHAWVEIPYDNGLWVTYDPTAGARIAATRSDAAANSGGWASMRDALERNVLFYDAGRQRDLFAQFLTFTVAVLTTITGWTAIALLVIILTWYARTAKKHRALAQAAIAGRGPIPIPSVPALAYYRDMLRLLKAKGLERSPHVTPREFVDVVRGRRDDLATPVTQITDLFEDERYGGREADPSVAGGALAQLRAGR